MRGVHRLVGLPLLLLMVNLLPTVYADISTHNRVMNLACASKDQCWLSLNAEGSGFIEVEETSANPLQPVTVQMVFPLTPTQSSLTLLPPRVDEIVLDLRIREDPNGWLKPDLDLALRIGASYNEWTISGGDVTSGSSPDPYRLEDEEIDLSNGRLLHPGDSVELRVTFILDRPVTWQLHLGGNSYFSISPSWSVDVDAENIDEPSSASSPRPLEDVEEKVQGALLGDDVDCFTFTLPENLLTLTIYLKWQDVPIEVAQPHHPPELFKPDGRLHSAPEVINELEQGFLVSRIKYASPETGEHLICWTGSSDRFQSYEWIGLLSYRGVGSTNPWEFSGEAIYFGGEVSQGDSSRSVTPSGVGWTGLFASIVLLVPTIWLLFIPLSHLSRRWMLPLTLILLLVSIAEPILSHVSFISEDDEMSVEELLSYRLDRIWEGTDPNLPPQSRLNLLGGWFGMLHGDRIQLRIPVDRTLPLVDGRWQSHTPELDEINLDDLTFGWLAEKGLAGNPAGSTDPHVVEFILQSGRLLVLDMLMLESLLVTDEPPEKKYIKVDWNIVNANPAGSSTSPSWATRPKEVSELDWGRLQRDIVPKILTISYCDCGIDSLELTWVPSDSVQANTLPTPKGIDAMQEVIPGGTFAPWVAGIFLVASVLHEGRLRGKARALAVEAMRESKTRRIRNN